MGKFLLCVFALVFIVLPASADANARLVSVTPVSGGCVSGPTGTFVQSWDVEIGETYTIRITHVTECANNGTDPTLNVRVNSTVVGNTDLVATFVAPGVYEFDFTMPLDALCTLPIFYCTTPGAGNTGLFVHRDDGVAFQAHLRASSFEPGCTNPTELIGPECGPVPVRDASWGAIKTLYN
jgi:hypothetical protein